MAGRRPRRLRLCPCRGAARQDRCLWPEHGYRLRGDAGARPAGGRGLARIRPMPRCPPVRRAACRWRAACRYRAPMADEQSGRRRSSDRPAAGAGADPARHRRTAPSRRKRRGAFTTRRDQPKELIEVEGASHAAVWFGPARDRAAGGAREVDRAVSAEPQPLLRPRGREHCAVRSTGPPPCRMPAGSRRSLGVQSAEPRAQRVPFVGAPELEGLAHRHLAHRRRMAAGRGQLRRASARRCRRRS